MLKKKQMLTKFTNLIQFKAALSTIKRKENYLSIITVLGIFYSIIKRGKWDVHAGKFSFGEKYQISHAVVISKLYALD